MTNSVRDWIRIADDYSGRIETIKQVLNKLKYRSEYSSKIEIRRGILGMWKRTEPQESIIEFTDSEVEILINAIVELNEKYKVDLKDAESKVTVVK